MLHHPHVLQDLISLLGGHGGDGGVDHAHWPVVIGRGAGLMTMEGMGLEGPAMGLVDGMGLEGPADTVVVMALVLALTGFTL